jgi:hypothetical protein
MKADRIKKYKEMFDRFNKGEITQEEWRKFCFVLLGEVMEENKDVFVRLKNR